MLNNKLNNNNKEISSKTHLSEDISLRRKEQVDFISQKRILKNKNIMQEIRDMYASSTDDIDLSQPTNSNVSAISTSPELPPRFDSFRATATINNQIFHLNKALLKANTNEETEKILAKINELKEKHLNKDSEYTKALCQQTIQKSNALIAHINKLLNDNSIDRVDLATNIEHAIMALHSYKKNIEDYKKYLNNDSINNHLNQLNEEIEKLDSCQRFSLLNQKIEELKKQYHNIENDIKHFQEKSNQLCQESFQLNQPIYQYQQYIYNMQQKLISHTETINHLQKASGQFPELTKQLITTYEKEIFLYNQEINKLQQKTNQFLTQPYINIKNKSIKLNFQNSEKQKNKLIEELNEIPHKLKLAQQELTQISQELDNNLKNLNIVPILHSKAYNELNTRLKQLNIEYNFVYEHNKKLSDDEIIKQLSAKDRTGYCVSLALSYIGQKKFNMNVTSFRAGKSQDFFSKNINNKFIPELVPKKFIKRDYGFSSVDVGVSLLNDIKNDNNNIGKEYYFACGHHVSIIKKNSEGVLQYLELQSNNPKNNKWTDFSENISDTLLKRFKAEKNNPIISETFLIDLDGFTSSESKTAENDLKSLLGYIHLY